MAKFQARYNWRNLWQVIFLLPACCVFLVVVRHKPIAETVYIGLSICAPLMGVLGWQILSRIEWIKADGKGLTWKPNIIRTCVSDWAGVARLSIEHGPSGDLLRVTLFQQDDYVGLNDPNTVRIDLTDKSAAQIIEGLSNYMPVSDERVRLG